MQYLLLVLWVSASLQAKVVLEAYGDSLTAGFMAGTNVTAAPSLSVISGILSDLASYGITKDAEYIKKHEKRDAAWPAVLAERFKEKYGEALPVENYGITGGKILQTLASLDYSPESASNRVSFFFVGHNDLSHSDFTESDVTGFLETYERTLLKWDQRREDSDVFVVPIADVPRVFETLEGYVWHRGGSRGTFRCEDSWEKLFPYGKRFGRMLKQGTLQDTVSPVLKAMNQGLRSLVRELNGVSRKNRYHFVEIPANMPMQPQHFAVDCYHLSVKGQAALANEIYSAPVS